MTDMIGKRSKTATLAVLGAGAWGTALANMAAGAHARVWLWAHDPAHVEAMRRDRRNDRRLPGVALAPQVEPVADLACVARGRPCARRGPGAEFPRDRSSVARPFASLARLW